KRNGKSNPIETLAGSREGSNCASVGGEGAGPVVRGKAQAVRSRRAIDVGSAAFAFSVPLVPNRGSGGGGRSPYTSVRAMRLRQWPIGAVGTNPDRGWRAPSTPAGDEE